MIASGTKCPRVIEAEGNDRLSVDIIEKTLPFLQVLISWSDRGQKVGHKRKMERRRLY